MSGERPKAEVDAHKAMADAVCFTRNMGELALGNKQTTPWRVAEHLLWSLTNDGWQLTPVPVPTQEPNHE